jgi:hypothetical protein
MSSARKLLESIIKKDAVNTKRIFEELMVDRLRDIVEVRKMEVGFRMMNGPDRQDR